MATYKRNEGLTPWQQVMAESYKNQHDLSMMNAAMNGNTNALMGYGLGKLLKGAFKSWNDNYNQRNLWNEYVKEIDNDPSKYSQYHLPEEWYGRLKPETQAAIESIKSGGSANDTSKYTTEGGGGWLTRYEKNGNEYEPSIYKSSAVEAFGKNNNPGIVVSNEEKYRFSAPKSDWW